MNGNRTEPGRRRRNRAARVTAALTAGALLMASTGLLAGCSKKLSDSMEELFPMPEEQTQNVGPVQSISRIQLLNFAGAEEAQITPSVPAYTVAPGLTNVMNTDQFYLSDDAVNKLEENLFVVTIAMVMNFLRCMRATGTTWFLTL